MSSGLEETKGGSPDRSQVWASSPTNKVVPHSSLKFEQEFTQTKVPRHVVPITLTEPKVQSPHKTRRGFAPRRIEVERKKREYATFNITKELENNGVIPELLKAKKSRESSVETIDQYALTLFDNTEYDSQPTEYWISLTQDQDETSPAGIPARAMFEMPPLKKKPFVIGEKKEDLLSRWSTRYGCIIFIRTWTSCYPTPKQTCG